MKKFSLMAVILAVLAVPMLALAQGNFGPPGGGAAGVQSTTIPIAAAYQIQGIVRVTNAATSGDCTTGGGTTVGTCYWNGTAWSSIASSGGATQTLGNLTSPTAINTSTLTFSGAGGLTAGGTNPITLTPGTTVNIAWPNGTHEVAGAPLSSDAIQYVSANGNDSNDGLSWGTAKLTITGAQTALPSTGGAVVTAPGYTATVAQQVAIGSATKPVALILGAGTTLKITTSTGVCEFPVANHSSITGPIVGILPSILVSSSASLSSVICNAVTDGTQQDMQVANLQIANVTGQTITVSSGAVLLDNIGENTSIQNVKVAGMGTKLLEVKRGGAYYVANSTFDCEGVAGCTPISLEGANGSQEHNVTLVATNFEHSPSGTDELVIAGGPNAWTLNSVHIINAYCEQDNANDCVSIYSASNVVIDGMQEGGTAGTNMVDILAGGSPGSIEVRNLFDQNGSTNFITNAISAQTLPKNQSLLMPLYVWSGNSYGDTTTPPFFDGGVNVIGSANLGGTLVDSSTAPTLTGFGTSPSVVASSGTAAFEINVGTGGTATSGTITFPAASHGWSVHCDDVTTRSTSVFVTKQTAFTTTTAVITQYSDAAVATAWAASDILVCQARAF